VRAELGTKVAFENDVNLAALGERWRGLGKGVANFVYLHLGTGVGAGLVLDGELYKGANGAAGEVGYLPLVRDARDRATRRRGALDAAAGSSGVVDTARRLGMGGPLSAKKVFAAARRGDRVALRVVAAESESIATAVAALAAVVDPLRLEQVLVNLLDNAVKYSPEGGRIELRLSRPTPEQFEVSVRDHGLGIPSENRAQIFERFYQAHPSAHRGGMGLGLYITRQIIELHGGTIRADFPPDGGTRFVVRLPVGVAAWSSIESSSASAA
jgi:signal transduction histidine kinase